MVYCLAFILFLNFIISYRVLGFKSNALFFFNIWWFFWFVVSLFNFLNLYTVSLMTYFLVVLGVVSLNIAYIFGFYFKGEKLLGFGPRTWRLNKVVELMYTLSILVLLFKMYNLIGGVEGYDKVRFYFFGLEFGGETISVFSSPVYAHAFLLLKAFSLLNFLISLPQYFFQGNRFLFLFSTLNILLYCVLSAGRDIVPYLIILVIFSIRMNLVGKVAGYLLGAGLFILLITFLREGGIGSTFYAVGAYFTGSIVYLDILLRQDGEFFYGAVLLSSLFAPVAYFLNKNAFTQVGVELMQFTRVSDSSPFFDYYNALPTWFYFFYRDFGYFGFIIVPLFLGFFLALLVRRLSFKIPDHVAIIAFIEFTLVWSIFKLEILSFYNFLVFIFYLNLLRSSKSVPYTSNRV